MRSTLARTTVAMCVLGAAACSSGSSSAPIATLAKSTTTTNVEVRTVSQQRPFEFTVNHKTFVDRSRPTATPSNAAYSPTRSLRTDLYVPASSAPSPLIIFSHGYHGAPSKFSELFSAWARAGYIVVAPEFPLTSNRGAPYDLLTDYVNQPGDISFVLSEVLDSPMGSQVDAKRIGAAGLSLGGATTFGLVYNPCCRDERIRAAAIFDAVRLPFGKPFESNKVPVLIAHIDTDIVAPYSVLQQAYAESASPKWLLTFRNGIHPEAYEDTPSPHDKTAVETSIDFFDLTLLNDETASTRLMKHGTNPGESTIVSG